MIRLKQESLQLMTLALAGTACGQLLSLLEFPFGYPESRDSKERGKQLEELECHFLTDEESIDDKDTITKAQDAEDTTTEFSTAPPKAKKRKFGQCHDELKDLVPLSKAVPIIPSTTVTLSETRVLRAHYSPREASEGQSIYRCLLQKPGSEATCTHYSAQLAVMATHIRRKHLQICVKCRLCAKRSFSTTTIAKHLKSAHPNQETEWFEPTPPLEGDTTEVTDAVLAANLQEVDEVKIEPEAPDQN